MNVQSINEKQSLTDLKKKNVRFQKILKFLEKQLTKRVNNENDDNGTDQQNLNTNIQIPDSQLNEKINNIKNIIEQGNEKINNIIEQGNKKIKNIIEKKIDTLENIIIIGNENINKEEQELNLEYGDIVNNNENIEYDETELIKKILDLTKNKNQKKESDEKESDEKESDEKELINKIEVLISGSMGKMIVNGNNKLENKIINENKNLENIIEKENNKLDNKIIYEHLEDIMITKLENENNYYKEYYENCEHCCICHLCLCCLKEENKITINNITQIETEEKNFDSFDDFIKNEEKKTLECKDIKCVHIFFLFIIFFHYYAIAHINSVMYSLFGEAKRCFFIYTNMWENVSKNSFSEYIKNSNIKDTSQINYFYLSSFLTSFILNICNIYVLYIICFIINIIILIRINFIEYLNQEQTENFKNYDFEDFVLYVIAPLVSLYIFTGLISSSPFYLVTRIKELSIITPWLINLMLVLAVIVKILFCDIININLVYFYLIGSFFTFCLFLIFYCVYKNDIFKEEKERINFDYLLGKFKISSEMFDISVKTKTFCNYLSSMFDRKLIFLMMINLCSRASKLKFKTDYKNFFEDSSIYFVIINFLLSFVIFIINICLKSKLTCTYCNSTETAFSSFIIFESFIIIIFSVVALFDIGDQWIKWISFKSIMISGSVNFLFSEYYSTEYINYLSISGLVSIAQIIFRILEFLIEPFKNSNWYWMQIGFSLTAIVTCIVSCCGNYYKFVRCCNIFNKCISCYNKLVS